MARMKRFIFSCLLIAALISILCIGANAYNYPAMPSNWQSLKVTVGDVTMPLAEYPDGSIFPGDKEYMTVAEGKQYGINLASNLWLRGSQCVAFARYTYAALFYKYPQDATMDNSLAYKYGSSYAYYNMIYKVLGQTTLAPGYSASTLKTLFTACVPGSVMRISGHSMVLMAVFSDGCIIYDSNFANGAGSFEVDVRKYTWQEFVDKLGGRGLEALQMPVYYPGVTYYVNGSKYWTTVTDAPDTPSIDYEVDTSYAGKYVVYNCSSVNVRSTPSTEKTAIGSLPAGTVVTVAGRYGDWYQIDYNGSAAWVSANYLKAYSGELTVTFDPNGGTAKYLSDTFEIGTAFGILPSVTKEKRTLIGWFDGSTQYTEKSIVPNVSALSLTARWGVNSYTDVNENAWYARFVENANDLGLIATDTRFFPDRQTTRGEFVTVLSRIYTKEYGALTVPDENPFTDLESGAYYRGPVLWASKVGVVSGITSDLFMPKNTVQRQQMAAFMYRYATAVAGKPMYQGDSLIYDFNDAEKVSSYAVTAMNWAIDAGIFKGDDKGNLNPQDPARRSEMAVVLTKFLTYLNS
ncbi:MAG: S-layer homology domain-containing protein [Oscillospiraceae bacterium]|nr:S-layer homology domain-containing protein [Oscillospiraceae bacterium]